MAMKVAPSGLPTWRRRACGELIAGSEDAMVVFSRKSCVIAMPMLAKESEVRSQARKVRSAGGWEVSEYSYCPIESRRERESVFRRAYEPRLYQLAESGWVGGGT
jgi:hypothetical protein